MPVASAARRLDHRKVLVIGGGNGGLSVAGRLRRLGVDDIAVIEPRTDHLYKPLFSHIAGGTAPASMAVRSQASVTPKGVEWIQDAVASISADTDSVTLVSGSTIGYDHLIVCPGIQQDWDAVPGLAEAMRAPEGISNYTFDLARKASTRLRALTSGTVVFSQPPGPASCAGAAQKPMYLACDYWRARGVLGEITVILLVPDETVFGMPDIDRELDRKIAEYGIQLHTLTTLQSVDAQNRTIVAAHPVRGAQTIAYDLLSVEPPQSAPDWLSESGLTDSAGFVDVDPHTLRHPRHSNVWALGDAASTLNSKSGGALRQQTMTLAKNLVAVLRGKQMPQRYNGYSVCPFTVSRSTVVFAEFDEQYRPAPTVPFWKSLARERRLTWVLDRHILPWVYWHMILQGRA